MKLKESRRTIATSMNAIITVKNADIAKETEQEKSKEQKKREKEKKKSNSRKISSKKLK